MRKRTGYTCMAGLCAVIALGVFAAGCRKTPQADSSAPTVEKTEPAKAAEKAAPTPAP